MEGGAGEDLINAFGLYMTLLVMMLLSVNYVIYKFVLLWKNLENNVREFSCSCD